MNNGLINKKLAVEATPKALNDLKLKGYLASKSEVYDRYSKQFKDVGLSIIEAENNEKLYNLAELFLKNSSIIKSKTANELTNSKFLFEELAAIFDSVSFDDDTAKQLYYTFKYSCVSIFFQENRIVKSWNHILYDKINDKEKQERTNYYIKQNIKRYNALGITWRVDIWLQIIAQDVSCRTRRFAVFVLYVKFEKQFLSMVQSSNILVAKCQNIFRFSIFYYFYNLVVKRSYRIVADKSTAVNILVPGGIHHGKFFLSFFHVLFIAEIHDIRRDVGRLATVHF